MKTTKNNLKVTKKYYKTVSFISYFIFEIQLKPRIKKELKRKKNIISS
jgi:hypothetical protein